MGFKRKIEDFTCGNCGAEVYGDGYTNHCPECLWGKHVDKKPGDRAEDCCGMMRPVRVEGATDEYSLVHQCEECGAIKKNRVARNDDVNAIAELAEKNSSREYERE